MIPDKLVALAEEELGRWEDWINPEEFKALMHLIRRRKPSTEPSSDLIR